MGNVYIGILIKFIITFCITFAVTTLALTKKEKNMHRKPTGPNDHAIFSRTAKRTRRINLKGTTLRGGTRL